MFEIDFADVAVGNTVHAGEYVGQVEHVTDTNIEVYWFELASNRSYTKEQAEANGFIYSV